MSDKERLNEDVSLTKREFIRSASIAGLFLGSLSGEAAAKLPSDHPAQRAVEDADTAGRASLERGVAPHSPGWILEPADEQVLVGDRPMGVAVAPDGRQVAVSNCGQGTQATMLVDPDSGSVVETIEYESPEALFVGIEFSPDGSTLYASAGTNNKIRVYDVGDGSLTEQEPIRLFSAEESGFAAGLDVTPDGKRLFVANNLADSVSVVDLESGAVEATVDVSPESEESERYPYTVTLDRKAEKAYVSSWGASDVSVIDADSLELLGHVSVADLPSDALPSAEAGPSDIVASPTRDEVYVAVTGTDEVAVVDTRRDKVTHTVDLQPYEGAPTGSLPNGLAVSPNGNTLYVANGGNNDVAVVDRVGLLFDADSLALQQGATETVDLTLSGVPEGLSGGRVVVSVTDADVATITGASYPDTFGLTQEPEISGDGTQVELEVADIERAVQPGTMDVVFASITLAGHGTGTTDLAVAVEKLSDENGEPVAAATRRGVVVTGPPPFAGSQAPTDPDGDALYEDLNGNGRLDYDDVAALFDNFEDDAVRLNKSAYDFNENGRLDFDDIVSLYNHIGAGDVGGDRGNDDEDDSPPDVSGLIPTGWFPSSVGMARDGSEIYVGNMKGTGTPPNPEGPVPTTSESSPQYIGNLTPGSMSIIGVPEGDELAAYTDQVVENNGFDETRNQLIRDPRDVEPRPIPEQVGEPSPIDHVIYVIKENRTYDQLFGDLRDENGNLIGNGEPDLQLFGERSTPNHRKLARDFALHDNFYCDAEVSADGHNWSVGAIADDYTQMTWPAGYSGRRGGYDYEGESYAEGESPTDGTPADQPGGYLWNAAEQEEVTFRSYGEYAVNRYRENASSPPSIEDFETAFPTLPGLEGKVDLDYPGYELGITDQSRIEVWLDEFENTYVPEDGPDLPEMSIIRLPNDHLAGTNPDFPTPQAMMADNDLAVGRLIEAVSKSRYWENTAIFITEDDAQNGPDHVDAHRSISLIASPYARRGVVDSTFYSTVSMLRTMELILGLPPLTQFDARATPMRASFIGPDEEPHFDYEYDAITPDQPTDEFNDLSAYGTDISEDLDLYEMEDQMDEDRYNRLIWHAIKGEDEPYPGTNTVFREGTPTERW